jgi:RHS repeat-associated protein
VIAGTAATPVLHYIESDHLGTPRVIVDATRNVGIWRWNQTNDPFGESTPNQNPDGDATSFTFNLRFAGQYRDSESGWHYNVHRYYDPAIGRYLESDPIGLGGGISTYSYVGAAPLSAVDPLGLAPCAAECGGSTWQPNYMKFGVGLANYGLGTWQVMSGGAKIAIALGFSPAATTGVGALPPMVLAFWGGWNINSGAASYRRANKLLYEAFREDPCDWRWKNLWGLAPAGTHYDDPHEPSGPIAYVREQGFWRFVAEAGYF